MAQFSAAVAVASVIQEIGVAASVIYMLRGAITKAFSRSYCMTFKEYFTYAFKFPPLQQLLDSNFLALVRILCQCFVYFIAIVDI